MRLAVRVWVRSWRMGVELRRVVLVMSSELLKPLAGLIYGLEI